MAGVGGAVGAASAVLLAGARASAAYEAFKTRFNDYFGARDDPPAQALKGDFILLDGALRGLMGAVEKLKRALRLR
jgi:hypothetical protein